MAAAKPQTQPTAARFPRWGPLLPCAALSQPLSFLYRPHGCTLGPSSCGLSFPSAIPAASRAAERAQAAACHPLPGGHGLRGQEACPGRAHWLAHLLIGSPKRAAHEGSKIFAMCSLHAPCSARIPGKGPLQLGAGSLAYCRLRVIKLSRASGTIPLAVKASIAPHKK